MNILSLKGGSVRGIITIIFLKEIEKITGKSIHDLFDYYGASSVGTLITSALLVSDNGIVPKYSAHQVYELFLKHITNSFSWTYYSYIYSGFGLLGPKYTNSGLNSIITECCQDYKLGNLLKPIIFPSYDRIRHKAYYFDKDDGMHLKLSDVIMACTAIPTYFQSYKMNIKDEKYDFLDSAIVANDTSHLVMLKASNIYSFDKSKILLLSIGTGTFPNIPTDNHGLITWLPNIVDTLLSAAADNELYELSLSLSKDNYFILDVPLNITYTPDDIRKSTIDYYITETTKWIDEHYDLMELYCSLLLKNKIK
jgi:patatin-like phospholipase/acyl hydrolase